MSQQQMAPAWQHVAEPQVDPALRVHAKLDYQSKFINPKVMFMAIGSIILSLLSIAPIWNAAILLQDSNYVFWVGWHTPVWLIGGCVGIVLAYMVTVAMFFRRAGVGASSSDIEQSIIMVTSLSIMVFGLFLIMISLPLAHQSELTQTNLLHRCGVSEQTHRLFEYSQVLQNIRATPACAVKYSVEECAGYEEASPYTNFLKGMENNFRCSGFCTPIAPTVGLRGPAQVQAGVTSPASAAALLAKKHRFLHTSLAVEALDAAKRGETTVSYLPLTYPPTLFSDMNFQASCDGMAARDIKNLAGDIGQQTFLQGIYLVMITVLTGILKLAGFCAHKV